MDDAPARPRRRFRRSLLAVALLVVVLVAAELLVVARAESRIGELVGAELGVGVRVELVGRPAAPDLLLGRIDHLRLAAEDVPLEGRAYRLASVSADVVDLAFADDRPTGGAGTFRATLDQAGVRAAAPEVLAPALVLDAEGLAVDVGLLRVPLALALDGEVVRVQPGGAAGVALQALEALTGGTLPPVDVDAPPGVEVQGVAVRDGLVVVTGQLDPVVVADGG